MSIAVLIAFSLLFLALIFILVVGIWILWKKPFTSLSIEINPKLLGLVCYLPFFGALLAFQFIYHKKGDKFVRFHALQSLILTIGIFAIGFISILTTFVVVFQWVFILAFPLYLFLMLQAGMGKMYELPIIGALVYERFEEILTAASR